MRKKVTLSDVARAAKVSKSTVSQYLNHRYEYMSDETRSRIEKTIKELGYRPNFLARSLKQKKTATIGVIVANILHRFTTEITRAIEDYCHSHDYHVIVCNTDETPSKEKKYIEMLIAKQVDGLVIIPTGENVDLYTKIAKEHYPVVFLDRKVEQVPVPTVVMDNFHAAYECATHLIGNGHHAISLITAPLSISTRIERVEGFLAALKDHGLEQSEKYIRNVPIRDIPETVSQLLSMPDPPTALLAGNDLVLMEILRYVMDHHVHVPQDIALAVIDDVSFADFLDPTLTTYKQPAVEMATKAAEILLSKIESRQKSDHQEMDGNDDMVIRFRGQLKIRKSSGPNRTG